MHPRLQLLLERVQTSIWNYSKVDPDTGNFTLEECVRAFNAVSMPKYMCGVDTQHHHLYLIVVERHERINDWRRGLHLPRSAYVICDVVVGFDPTTGRGRLYKDRPGLFHDLVRPCNTN